MAFKFSLATVLRVRGMVEDREERMLPRIQQEISQTRQAVAQADLDIAASNASRAAEVFKPSAGANVHAAYGGIQQLKQNREEYEAQLGKLEELKQMQLDVYRAARRDREMLSDMRAKQRDVHASDQARREQSTMDDIFSARRSRA